jgi:hypothetical protein
VEFLVNNNFVNWDITGLTLADQFLSRLLKDTKDFVVVDFPEIGNRD